MDGCMSNLGGGLRGDSGLAAGLDDPVATNLVNRMDCVLEPFRSGACMTNFLFFQTGCVQKARLRCSSSGG